jgi:hypothetical protein
VHRIEELSNDYKQRHDADNQLKKVAAKCRRTETELPLDFATNDS